MAKRKVVILGSTGMLGSMMLDLFVKNHEFNIVTTYRNQNLANLIKKKYPEVVFRKIEAEKANLKDVASVIKGSKWVINAVGIIKPYIHDDNAGEVKRAIYVNAFFPHLLAEAARRTKIKIIQIATDCVFSGKRGQYVETDGHDALDVYGKTKSLGEVFGDGIYHLRCSVVGPEIKAHISLMDWLLSQPKRAKLSGFTNHRWNGLTTLHFARICYGIIKRDVSLPHIQHIIPGNSISKAELLKTIARHFNRQDVTIDRIKAPTAIDRTLVTHNPGLNHKLWRLAGYVKPPTIAKMIRELAQ